MPKYYSGLICPDYIKRYLIFFFYNTKQLKLLLNTMFDRWKDINNGFFILYYDKIYG